MHKKRLNEAQLQILIEPYGPLLIKSGLDSGADPTRPSMSFVRSTHPTELAETIYLPGASLKGVLRSHAERILRSTLGENDSTACDPVRSSCGNERSLQRAGSAQKYAGSCLACRTFGNTVVGSRFLTADAYPETPINTLPLRQNVAIDRRTGSVGHGPFDMEVATAGRFATTLHLVNFELWQLGLVALTLRDLDEGRVRMGFAKSRGLGRVRVHMTRLEIAYPGQFGAQNDRFQSELLGLGALVEPDEIRQYDLKAGDDRRALDGVAVTTDAEAAVWGRPTIWAGIDDNAWPTANADELGAATAAVRALLTPAVAAWVSLATAQRGVR